MEENNGNNTEERFYDKLKRIMRNFVKKISKNNVEAMTIQKYLMLVPDIFILCVRLLRDKEVRLGAKFQLSLAIAYFINPLDLFPETIVGPIGFIEDLAIATFVLKKLVSSIGIEKIREHWSGDEEIVVYLEAGHNFLNDLFSQQNYRKLEETLKEEK